MIADIALVCDSPVVLIDEIENAGVDKEKAFLHLKTKINWCWWSHTIPIPP